MGTTHPQPFLKTSFGTCYQVPAQWTVNATGEAASVTASWGLADSSKKELAS